jgi:TRAP-type C4-dicarboxylate transport system substrate-binding protein
MNIRSLLPWLTALSAAAAATLALGPGAGAQQTFNATLVSAAPAGSVWATQLTALKNRIESKTDSRVQVNLVFGGSETALLNQVKASTAQAGAFSTAAIAHTGAVPRLQVVELPYLFTSTAEVDHILDTIVRTPITADLDAKGLVFGMWGDNGWLNFTSKATVFDTPAQLAGVPMRREAGWLHQRLFTALGGSATALELDQIAPQLQSGAVVGLEASVQYLAASGLTPIKKVSETKHIFQPTMVVWSEGFWDTLPPDLKSKIRTAQDELLSPSRQAVRAQEATARTQLLGQGVTFHTPTGIPAFTAQTQSMYAEYSALSPESAQLLQQVQAALTTLRGQ